MVCCLYVGICFGVVPHHMLDHVVTLAWHTRPHKIRSQIHELTCEACHVHNRRGFGANDGIFLGMDLRSISPMSMAVIVYVSIFPQLCLICVHMPISGLPLWCNSCTCPPPCLHRRVERKPAVWIGFGLCLGIARVCVKEFFSIFCGNADPGEEQDPRSDGLWWKGYSRGRSW